jgi:hypothetical protein
VAAQRKRAPTDWHRGLAQVPKASPRRRADVRLGTSAGRPVWWSLWDDALLLTVGTDIESGDVIVSMPVTLLNEIRAQVAEAANE